MPGLGSAVSSEDGLKPETLDGCEFDELENEELKIVEGVIGKEVVKKEV